MSAKKTDISHIRKYLNGELDARAMHQLEREAQDDPFLMDAIAGYENAGTDQQPNLAALDNLLQQRINQAKIRRMVPWKYISIAASLVLILGIAYLLWPGTKTPQLKQEQLVAKTPPPVDHVLTKSDTAPKLTADNNIAAISPQVIKKSRQAEIKPADGSVSEQGTNDSRMANPVVNTEIALAATQDKQVTEVNAKKLPADARENEQVVYGYVKPAARSAEPTANDSTVLKEITVPGRQALAKQLSTSSVSAVTNQTLKNKVEGVEVTTPNKISGRVMDELGLPLPGVNVQVVGTQKGTQTDVNGKFSLPATGNTTLSINYIGFESKRVTAKSNDSLSIKLQPNTKSLSEVVVTNYGQAKAEEPIEEAHPRMGWDSYDKYLRKAAIADDGKTGVVRVSFIVGEKGALSDFKIIKGLNDATNKRAIDLVKEGPPWEADASGKPKTVKLRIKFRKE
ncbi:energy transducer TonB [Mucilaginibacter boryungensis]|uniref:Carboxypeptidase-like regulatory domain-containing protein n=1 Tax=Mucilaginibacter boryungensis TaxID=768480 RepID=A0ABR9XKW7_9SPHI|nr:carboxypeptidase-like regulatory domain-containing protein [Mucilaginibacter boryungensis]MBE9668013.1 carboxypeptidase-like regulatory domain-containing protein [Mucilaginibacter boryungensis]